MHDLNHERDRVLPLLGPDAPTFVATDLPEDPGLYALWASKQRTCTDLGLEAVDGEKPLLQRPLYIGKAQGSLRERVAEKHMVSGDTGHSTVRRTFGALLDLESCPRRTTLISPTPRQLRTLTANYDLIPDDDDKLTAWMSSNLIIRGARSDWQPLRDLERAVGAIMRPPLDQEPRPMWEPNPWRSQVSDARERLRRRARDR